MAIFEFLYYLGYSAKKYYSLRNRRRLPYKVISIGNITAGGTGKTPAVIACAEEAKRRGLNPVILTRGYKGKAKGPCFVHDTRYTIQDAGYTIHDNKKLASCIVHHASYLLFGDEPVLMAEKLKGVPIVKCADRYKGGMFAIESLQPSALSPQPIIFILDDGFQHWRLFRDKDILLIDAANPFDNRRLLPVGLLREPLKEIQRADTIVMTKTENINRAIIEGLVEEIKQYNPDAPIFLSEHKPAGFIGLSGEILPLEWAKDKKLFAISGIGNPGSFKKTLISVGCDLKGVKTYRDHYEYKQNDIENILITAKKIDADWIVVTEKDMVRLKGLDLPDNLIALRIEFKVDEGFYDKVFEL